MKWLIALAVLCVLIVAYKLYTAPILDTGGPSVWDQTGIKVRIQGETDAQWGQRIMTMLGVDNTLTSGFYWNQLAGKDVLDIGTAQEYTMGAVMLGSKSIVNNGLAWEDGMLRGF